MSGYGIDKVINELKGRCGDKFDVDGIMGMIDQMKHAPEEGVAVVEIEAEPVEEVESPTPEEKEKETKIGEAEEPELPGNPSSDCDEKSEDEDETPEVEQSTTEEKLDAPTPEEQDRMDEVLKAIKTFFPNENTEDVLVRMVSKLIGL